MIDWFKKHRVLFALICVVILLLLMGVPFVINKTLWRRWNITILQYHVLPKFRETGIRLQIALQI